MNLEDALLCFADDEHLMGQQHTEWIGVAPFLEEDLAFASIGQDELGHAALLYELVLELRGVEVTDLAIDELAYGRSHDDYRSSHFVEYQTTNWAEALVRHWVYDRFEQMRWSKAAELAHPPLLDIAERAMSEEAFHLRHADALIDALWGSAEARERLLAALDTILPLVPSLLTAAPSLCADLAAAIGGRFDLNPLPTLSALDDDRRTRSHDFAPLMARMREVLDLDPAAVW